MMFSIEDASVLYALCLDVHWCRWLLLSFSHLEISFWRFQTYNLELSKTLWFIFGNDLFLEILCSHSIRSCGNWDWHTSLLIYARVNIVVLIQTLWLPSVQNYSLSYAAPAGNEWCAKDEGYKYCEKIRGWFIQVISLKGIL